VPVPRGSEPQRIDRIEEPIRVLACLADIHANTAALDAVINSPEFAMANAVAFLGCTTVGPDPAGTLALCYSLAIPAFYLAGNGERAIVEMASGVREFERDLDPWLVAAHGEAELAAIRRWPSGLTCQLSCGRRLRLCHGSPSFASTPARLRWPA
jgi:hypothetical protein